MNPTPSQSQVMTALRAFLITLVPQGTAQFSGSISGSTLTAGAPTGGTLALGTAIMGQGVAAGTYIVGLGSGTGGAGTYAINQPQTVAQTFLWTGVPIVQGQVNRVPEPKQGDLVVMWPILKRRLSTNIRNRDDVAFMGSIAGSTLTVTAMETGVIQANRTLFGAGISPNTRVIAPIAGAGGAGTYLVTPSQTTALTLMSTSQELITEPTEYTVQIDVHGPNSADNAQVISALFRDAYATQIFAALNPSVQPLHADDPRQIPFTNGEQQVETRWVINAVMQANYTIDVPQQYADEAHVTPIEIEAAFPA